MIQPEPLHFAVAHYLFEDVKATLETWQADLDTRRRERVAQFEKRLAASAVAPGATFTDHADIQADAAIERWCAERGCLAEDAVSRLKPETVAAAQQLGMAGKLGELIGLHLDNTLRELDADLRAAIVTRRQS